MCAGIGAIIGMTASLVRKGNDVLIQPGDEIKVNVNESVALPVMSEKALRDEELTLDGLNVRILRYTVEKDPFGELNTITLALAVKNNTDKTFSTFDMALLSDYKTVYYASPFGDTSMWFTKNLSKFRNERKFIFLLLIIQRKDTGWFSMITGQENLLQSFL